MFRLITPCIRLLLVHTVCCVLGDSCQCSGVLFGLDPILKTLPAWFRFAQCLRRYRDMEVKKPTPHVVNAGKYSTTFFVTASSVWLQLSPSRSHAISCFPFEFSGEKLQPKRSNFFATLGLIYPYYHFQECL